jgi:hypothetical protein
MSLKVYTYTIFGNDLSATGLLLASQEDPVTVILSRVRLPRMFRERCCMLRHLQSVDPQGCLTRKARRQES